MTGGEAERERLYELALKARSQLGPTSSKWRERLEPHRNELDGAIFSYLAQGDPRGAEMAAAVWQLWWLGGHLDEGRTLLRRVLESNVVMSPDVRADLLRGLGTIVFRQGDNNEAERIFGESLAIAKALDPVRHVNALCDMSRVALRRGEFDSVREHAVRAYELAQAIPGDEGKAGRRTPAHMLAAAARMQSDYSQARRYYEESQNISRELGNEASVAGEHHNLGYVNLHSGDLGAARGHFRQALEWVASSRDMYILPYCLVDSAVLALRDGELDRAATLLAGADTVFEATGAVPDPDDRFEVDGCRVELQSRLDAEVYKNALERGRTLTIDEMLKLALAY